MTTQIDITFSDISDMLEKCDIGQGEQEYKRAKELIESMGMGEREKEFALAIAKGWCGV